MAHNIATHVSANGSERRSFYSLRESPWHKLGTVVDLSLSDPAILNVAGLAWTPRKVPLYTAEMDPIPDHMAIKRSDDGRVLGIVGAGYEPVSNESMFSFLRQAADLGSLTIETAGALGNGETVWALARSPALDLMLGNGDGDYSKGYLLITTSHIGEKKLVVQPTCVRVVCQNTLTISLARRSGFHNRGTLAGGFAIRHTKGIHAALADVANAYRRAIEAHAATKQAAELLARTALKEAHVRSLLDTIFALPAGPDEAGRAATIRKEREARIRAILAGPTCSGPLVGGTGGSLWSFYNAVSEFVDHERTTRAGEGRDPAAQRFASANFGGSGAKLKALAWDAALALAK